jgi:hypothetical protein
MGLALALAGDPASAAKPHHARPASCPPRYESLIAADAVAALYIPWSSPKLGEPFFGEEIWGCARGARHGHALGPPVGTGSPEGFGGIDQETLAGPIVAYEYVHSGGYESTGPGVSVIIVRDLRTDKTLHKEDTGSAPKPYPSIGAATIIVVKSDGAVAWIAKVRAEAGTYQVHAVDGSGARLLASGADIEPDSLALAGSTLYWIQDGKPEVATLH